MATYLAFLNPINKYSLLVLVEADNKSLLKWPVCSVPLKSHLLVASIDIHYGWSNHKWIVLDTGVNEVQNVPSEVVQHSITLWR